MYLPIYLSVYLSIYLSVCKFENEGILQAFLIFLTSTPTLELDNVRSAAILRDFLNFWT